MPTFGLIDANSFYCSAERAFAPELWGRPVVVLSNNDGCAISRSAEAKQAGVRMAEPWHLARRRAELAEVRWFSSNYALYGDMSRRMYQVLAAMVPAVEPYSIDEMFLDLSDLPGDLVARCRRIRAAVRRLAKVPSCVGIGPTKTIAKLANGVAKDRPEFGGVCDLRDAGARAALYATMPVGEVWGVGGRTAARLAAMGVETIADFTRLDPRQARDALTVIGARIQAELRGVSCLPLALLAPARKGLAVTRCFGRPVHGWAELREAVAAHAARCGEKLRAGGLLAGHMAVFAHTDPHARDGLWHSAQRASRIEPTADTRALIGEAARLLRGCWKPGLAWFKTGVVLAELLPAAGQPAMLFPSRDPEASARTMAALDAVNARFGRDTLRVAATGLERSWGTRHDHRSGRYTTRLEEIMAARAL